jgi:hypothetical protein
MSDNLTAEQREHVEALKVKRATLPTTIERIAFDNDPTNGATALRIIAMTEAG